MAVPRSVRRRLWFYGTALLGCGGIVLYSTAMPARSHAGSLPAAEPALLQLGERLQGHVRELSEGIGERRVGEGRTLVAARDYLLRALEPLARTGSGKLSLETLGADGVEAQNVIFEIPGREAEIVLVGAHYDTAPGTRGANDNASGVASALELARHFGPAEPRRTLRFVWFANEEPPFFQNPGMGSLQHAAGCAQRKEAIRAMLALESLAYYSHEEDSQRYPGALAMFYPRTGDFVAFVGNWTSRSLVRESIAAFRDTEPFPSEGAALPGAIPGVGWSDHWSFWQHGYPAVMVTDTAVFRDPHYHMPDDALGHLDFDGLARVTRGLQHVVAALLDAD